MNTITLDTQTVVARRSTFFWGQLVGMLVMMGGGVGLTYSFFSHIGRQKTTTFEQLGLIFGFFVFVWGIYLIWDLVEHAPVWRLDTEKMSNGDQTVMWDDVERVNLFGHAFSMYEPTNGGSIVYLKNGKKLIVSDSLYTNTPEIKRFLARQFNLQPSEPVWTPADTNTPVDTEVKFRWGNPFRHFLWYIVMFFIILTVYQFSRELSYGEPQPGWAFLGMALCFYPMVGFGFYYYGFSEEKLVIRNPLFFWMEDSYHFSRIKAIILENDNSKMNTPLIRVVTHDYQQKRYRAEWYSKKQWNWVEETLKNAGVTVQNRLN